MRVILCDDSVLFREGLSRVLADMSFTVVAQTDNAEDLVRTAAAVESDVAVVDVRMPPTFTQEGIQAALALGEEVPGLGVLVLSQYIETRATLTLLQHRGGGRGYLLKDRISDLSEFAEAIRRVGEGGSVVDPEVAAVLVGRRRGSGALDAMSARELEILKLMAEGRSNMGICERLVLSPRTVESHVSAIFRKLGLDEQPDDHRRVLAVLAYLKPGTAPAG
jgi:DNA-binding NarL/FixJ family response regulator